MSDVSVLNDLPAVKDSNIESLSCTEMSSKTRNEYSNSATLIEASVYCQAPSDQFRLWPDGGSPGDDIVMQQLFVPV